MTFAFCSAQILANDAPIPNLAPNMSMFRSDKLKLSSFFFEDINHPTHFYFCGWKTTPNKIPVNIEVWAVIKLSLKRTAKKDHQLD